MNWRLYCCIAHIRSGKGCKGSLNFLMICPYMVKKTLYQIELNLLKAFFPVWDILFSYSETLSENGSHELTGALHILGPTLEAMNWRHCIPRVGVHNIESTLCPTVADWSLSDRGQLEPVRPWSIGQLYACILIGFYPHFGCISRRALVMMRAYVVPPWGKRWEEKGLKFLLNIFTIAF